MKRGGVQIGASCKDCARRWNGIAFCIGGDFLGIDVDAIEWPFRNFVNAARRVAVKSEIRVGRGSERGYHARFESMLMEAPATNSKAPMKAKLTYVPSQPFTLKSHSDFDESWLEKQIVEHPEILALDTKKVVRSQVLQKSGGKVDLLLSDEDNEVLYTVELMLGAVDASHIVRTLDYFLREQTRPETVDWTHVAVLVAEDIRGSRFLGVVEYLSKRMPLIVIELSALRVGENLTLKSTRIFDGTMEREEEIEQQEDCTREYWVKKSSIASIEFVEKFFLILQELAKDLRQTYKKHFIGIAIGNRAENFVSFSPKRDFVRVRVQISNAADWKKRIGDVGFKVLEGDESVRFRIVPQQFEQHRHLLVELFDQSYREWFE